MARVTYVKKAQQRYYTRPVLGPDGQQVKTPVMRRNGEQKTTKTGRLVFLSKTENDLSRPKPNRHCDNCGAEIQIGQPYKHVTPKSGPYGGTTRVRCGTCPTWEVWELSQSLSARLSQISHDFHAAEPFESPEDVTSALESAADEIRSLAEEKREGASNIEEGFGHETQQSQELNETADSLEAWADEVAGAEVPELPEAEEDDCEECDGTGSIVGDVPDEPEDCEQCNGTGRYTPDEPTDEQMDEWRDEVGSAISIVDESPV